MNNLPSHLAKQIAEEVKHAHKTLGLPKHMCDTLEIGLKKGVTMALSTRQDDNPPRFRKGE